MTPPKRLQDWNDGDRRWRALVHRARQAPAQREPALAAGFSQRVLAEAARRAAHRPAHGSQRLVGLAAGLALAASLLVAAWGWNDVQALLAAGPASLEQIVQLEPVP